MPSLLILTASILAQFTAAGLALHSWKLSRWQFGWGLLGLAFLLMGVRRSISFYGLSTAESLPQDFNPAELVALAISLLMVLGVFAVRKLIADMEKAKKATSDISTRLETAQYIAHVGNWEWDIQTGGLWWSDEIYRIFGITPRAFAATYEAFLNAVHKDDRDAVQNAVTNSLETHIPYSIEHRVVWPDGTERIVHEQGKATYSDDGTPLHMSGTVQDITERKDAERQIQKLNTELEQRVEARTAEAVAEREKAEHYLAIAGTMIVALDTRGRVSMINQKGADILGWTPEEMIGKCWFHAVIPEEVRDDVQGVFARIMAGDMDAIEHYENEIITRTGERRSIAWHNTLIRDKDGTITGALSAGDDITERLEHESSLRDAKDAAENANKAKSGFLSNMSHELRTPMNAILGFGQLLETAENLTTKQQEYTGHILASGHHLLELINEILDLSKIEAGQMNLSIEPTQPEDALMECMNLIKPIADKANILLLGHDDTVTLPEINADYIRFKQVMMNLLSNAIKYNRPEGTVAVNFNKTPDNYLQISVKDTGVGIAKQHYGDIFQPFSRLSAENSGIEGTGVGLTLTKKLVELMNGRIGFTSTESQGSTFWVDLPLTERGRTEEIVKSAAPEKTDAETPAYSLLYVEDNPANLRLMEEIISDIPEIKLISAHTAELGLEIAESRTPDLIVLDINLPGMSGMDALKRLKAHVTLKDVPVIALSANAMKDDIRKALTAGFDHYLTKPINVKATTTAIRDALNLPAKNVIPIKAKNKSAS